MGIRILHNHDKSEIGPCHIALMNIRKTSCKPNLSRLGREFLARSTARIALRFAVLAYLAVAAILLAPARPALAADDLKANLQRGLFEEEANHNLPAAISTYESVLVQFDKNREWAATAIFRLGECYRKLERTNEATGCYQRIVREFPENATLARLSQQNLLTLSPTPAAGRADAVAEQARAQARPASARQASLIREGLKLAEEQLNQARQRVQVGVAPSGNSLPYEREVLHLKRELTGALGGENSRAEQEKFLREEIALAERQLKEVQAKAAAGTAANDEEPNCRKDLLGLKRELAALEEGATGAALPPVSEEDAELHRIQNLLKDSPDLINARNSEGLTPLQDAAARGRVSVLQFLLANHALLEVRSSSGETALTIAAAQGHKPVVELLLEKGRTFTPAARTSAPRFMPPPATGSKPSPKFSSPAKPKWTHPTPTASLLFTSPPRKGSTL